MTDADTGTSKRRTIQDIASAAGVSTASVSYALNGKPGVSDVTRARILAIAREHNWEPNHQAQALHSARTDVIGFVIPANNAALSEEPFWIQFISGLEQALRIRGRSLLLHTEEHVKVEMDIYRSWRNRNVVDGVVLTDLRPDDARIPMLQEIGLPAILAGKPDPDLGLSYCFASDYDDMLGLMDYLHGLGLRTFARVVGDPSYVFVRDREAAAASFLQEHGLPPLVTAEAGFLSEEALLGAIETLLTVRPRPQVIIADSDLLAVRTLHAVQARGLMVPDDIQIVSFDDSSICRLVTPAITSLERRPSTVGHAAGKLIVDIPVEQEIITVQPAAIRARGTTRALR